MGSQKLIPRNMLSGTIRSLNDTVFLAEFYDNTGRTVAPPCTNTICVITSSDITNIIMYSSSKIDNIITFDYEINKQGFRVLFGIGMITTLCMLCGFMAIIYNDCNNKVKPIDFSSRVGKNRNMDEIIGHKFDLNLNPPNNSKRSNESDYDIHKGIMVYMIPSSDDEGSGSGSANEAIGPE